MPRFNAENVRVRKAYLTYLREAKGQDEKSLSKASAAILDFEKSTGWKSFKKFHVEQAVGFKRFWAKKVTARGRPLAVTTVDATLRLVKNFIEWLAGRPGYSRVVRYSDVAYFNNNRKAARAAHAERPIQYPSMEAAAHAFQTMPVRTDVERRDKAIFAFLMLTGARDSAVATFRLKHINLIDRTVFQDGREVKTKNSKTFTTTFFPVDAVYLEFFTDWVNYLREEKFYGAEDALFPKPQMRRIDGKFNHEALSRDGYDNGQRINAVVKTAFANVQLPAYVAHSIRKTLTKLMSDMDLSLEEQKAWSQNLGHENFITTVSSYLPVSAEQQHRLIRGTLAKSSV